MFSCNNSCERFFTYSSKTIDIKGINAKLKDAGTEIVDLGIAELSIKPEFVVSSEKLQNLDLLQFSMCQDLNKLDSKSPKREELILKNNITYRKMIEIAQGVRVDEQQMEKIILDIDKQMLVNSMDRNGCVDVVVPAGAQNPDAGYLANALDKKLRQKGYNIQDRTSMYIGGTVDEKGIHYKTGVSYKFDSSDQCLIVMVWLDN